MACTSPVPSVSRRRPFERESRPRLAQPLTEQRRDTIAQCQSIVAEKQRHRFCLDLEEKLHLLLPDLDSEGRAKLVFCKPEALAQHALMIDSGTPSSYNALSCRSSASPPHLRYEVKSEKPYPGLDEAFDANHAAHRGLEDQRLDSNAVASPTRCHILSGIQAIEMSWAGRGKGSSVNRDYRAILRPRDSAGRVSKTSRQPRLRC